MRSIDIRRGFRANLPIAVSVAAYGSVLGVLAAQKQISWFVLLLMNLSYICGLRAVCHGRYVVAAFAHRRNCDGRGGHQSALSSDRRLA